jgi:hypothetical protein
MQLVISSEPLRRTKQQGLTMPPRILVCHFCLVQLGGGTGVEGGLGLNALALQLNPTGLTGFSSCSSFDSSRQICIAVLAPRLGPLPGRSLPGSGLPKGDVRLGALIFGKYSEKQMISRQNDFVWDQKFSSWAF